MFSHKLMYILPGTTACHICTIVNILGRSVFYAVSVNCLKNPDT